MRLVLAVLAGAATAAFSALILGEYEFVGTTPYVAGLLFGLVVAEAMVTVARRGGVRLAAVAAALAAAGLVWAAWISSGRDWEYVPGLAWVAVGLGAASAGLRTARAAVRRSGPPAGDSPPSP